MAWSRWTAAEVGDRINFVLDYFGERKSCRVGPYYIGRKRNEAFQRTIIYCEIRRLFRKTIPLFNVEIVDKEATSEPGEIFYWWDHEINRLRGLLERIEE